MAHITNQWIDRGFGIRNRGYAPVEVKLEFHRTSTKFDRDHNVLLTINARRKGGDLQVLHLTEDECLQTFSSCSDGLSEPSRLILAAKCLSGLSDESVLKVLEAVFSARRAARKKTLAQQRS